METKTTPKIISKVKKKVKAINRQKLEHKFGQQNKTNKLLNKRLGKLLQNSKHEASNTRHRQTFKNKNTSNNMETVESTEKTGMGTQEAGGKPERRPRIFIHQRKKWKEQ